MNLKTNIISFVFSVLMSSSLFAQYKYDIGLKFSTYEMERFQLEQRFHLDSPYSITATFVMGSHYSGEYEQTPIYNDSLIDITDIGFRVRNTALKIGVQRKLGFLATDVFYAGAAIGVGFEQRGNSSRMTTYVVEDSVVDNPFIFDGNTEVVNSNSESYRTNGMNAQLALSFGMDVPIFKRFSINAEIAMSAIYRKSYSHSYSGIYFRPFVSGGLRYSFGKRE